MDEKDNLPLIIGVVATVLAGAFLYAGRHGETPAPRPLIAESVPAPSQPEDTRLPTTYPDQQQPETRQVYECEKDGKREFSDSPCGNNPQVRTLSPINGMEAPQHIYKSDPALSTPIRRSAEQGDADAQRRDCSGYEEDVKRIDARMRMGYTSAEGEYWRQRRRDAASARDECERDNRLR